MNVSDIIKKAADTGRFIDGARAIVQSVTNDGSTSLKVDAVRKWPKIGIPDRYWPEIIILTSVTVDDLYEANVTARSGVAEESGGVPSPNEFDAA